MPMLAETNSTTLELYRYLSGDHVTLVQPHYEAWPSRALELDSSLLAFVPAPEIRALSIREQRGLHRALLRSVEIID